MQEQVLLTEPSLQPMPLANLYCCTDFVSLNRLSITYTIEHLSMNVFYHVAIQISVGFFCSGLSSISFYFQSS